MDLGGLWSRVWWLWSRLLLGSQQGHVSPQLASSFVVSSKGKEKAKCRLQQGPWSPTRQGIPSIEMIFDVRISRANVHTGKRKIPTKGEEWNLTILNPLRCNHGEKERKDEDDVGNRPGEDEEKPGAGCEIIPIYEEGGERGMM